MNREGVIRKNLAGYRDFEKEKGVKIKPVRSILIAVVNSPITKTQIPDVFEEFTNQFLRDVKNSLSTEMVLTHFYFQDLSQYFRLLGEQKSGEILTDLKSVIQAHLRPYDKLYVLNSRSFMTFCPDCRLDIVKSRFDEVIFQVNHLIIDYEIRFLEITEPLDSFRPVYEKLLRPLIG
ncbi:hypothetical protein LEP1GSC050_1327 [Leptospira broomii serovar Hurstbridge str. 5399]|uniref:Uncharacterized protein n=1 Tax=Leptospira broomii serovar Hurstbridge str. 5399 TaxID=1049789 RepID=T0F738_9LEPT|nr:hypothetical protein LEP1GSC050_1327 [Leptospira broomii serovar Hurstbridge str. 5399]